ncbi:hypothetical protein F5Y19DRAFT_435966 [Xylariaceae sp. FL1651]|nr:hypothetical protein F5Y19DRAFT_435966 [Xylariaceae sp. FL1651]
MLSTVKDQFVKIVDLIPVLRSHRRAMAEKPKFVATDNFKHKYQDKEVLRKALIEFGFKDEEIHMQISDAHGLEANLSRRVKDEERLIIFERFKKAKAESRRPGDQKDEED